MEYKLCNKYERKVNLLMRKLFFGMVTFFGVCLLITTSEVRADELSDLKEAASLLSSVKMDMLLPEDQIKALKSYQRVMSAIQIIEAKGNKKPFESRDYYNCDAAIKGARYNCTLAIYNGCSNAPATTTWANGWCYAVVFGTRF